MGRIRQAFRRRGGEDGQDDVNVTTVVHSVLTTYAPEDSAQSVIVLDDTVVSSVEHRSGGSQRGDAAMPSLSSLPHRAPPPSALTGSLSDRAALLHELVDAHTRKVARKTHVTAGEREEAAPPTAASDDRSAANQPQSTADAGGRATGDIAVTRRHSPWSSIPAPRVSAPAPAVQQATPQAPHPFAGNDASITGDTAGQRQVAMPNRESTAAQPAVARTASPQTSDPAPGNDNEDAAELIDTRQLGNYFGFLFRSVRRHWILFTAISIVMAAATTAATLVWPKSYQVYATLLVQRNEKMASLVNPGRTISPEAESPTRAAEQIVLQQQNLRALIQQTDLLFRWEQTRTPLLRVKDRVFSYLRGPQSDDDKADSMVGLLEARLKVFTTPEGSVTFELRWPDPQMAYDIVDHAVQNFLEFRKQSETSAIADSISILDQSVDTLEEKVRQTIAELPKRRPASAVRRPAEPAPAAAVAAAVVPPQAPPAELVNRLTRMKAEIEARRREVTRLEDLHRQQLSEAQARLAAAKTVYGDDFPTVMALRQAVEQLTRESPELTSLRRDTQAAETEYDTMAAALQTPGPDGVPASGLPPELQLRQTARVTEPPPIEVNIGDTMDAEMSDPTTLRLRVELAELAAVRGRANAARAELSSSQAGFKYQYTIITPPQVPRGPISPNVPAFVGGGILASLLLALLAVAMADLLSDRFLESWQVEQHLGAPVGLSVKELS